MPIPFGYRSPLPLQGEVVVLLHPSGYSCGSIGTFHREESRSMRAAVFSEFGGPEVVHLEEMEVPEPGPGEVRLSVRAAAMNHLDLWIRRGLPLKITMPHIGGSDVAGVVDALGPGVEGVELGTPVVVDPSLDYHWYQGIDSGSGIPAPEFRIIGEHTQGGFAEYTVVPAENLVGLPEEVPFETAAAASLVSVTAWRGLMVRGGLRAGERVLVTGGSGGVSTMAIQIARLAGAQVFVVTSGAENVDRVLELGAHVAYDRTAVDWGKALFKDTETRGVDLILDSVGQALWPQCLKALGVGGRLVTFGATTGAAGETEIRLVFWKQLSILGSTMGTPEDYRRVMALVFQGELNPPIHTVLPLEEARRAHEILEAGEAFGKVVLKP
jgi:NADPH:quinone reductase-like Zn-dependent oxidoreductase